MRDNPDGTGSVQAAARSADGKARLVVRCDRQKDKIVSVQFIPTPPFPPALKRPVSLKVDDEAWLGTNWEFPGNGAYNAEAPVVTTLTAAIARAKAIRLRVIDPANQVVEANFAGPGSDAPVRQVLLACGYTLGTVPEWAVPPPPPPENPDAVEVPG